MRSKRLSQSSFIRQLAVSGLERPSWTEAIGNNRRVDREPVVIDAILHQASLKEISITLLDFSQDGCSFATIGQFRKDEPFFLHLEGIEPLRAKAAWNDDLRYGCAFDKSIHQAVAAHITKTLSRGDQRSDFETRMTRVKTSISRH